MNNRAAKLICCFCVATGLVCFLASCGDPDLRELAGGYRLKRTSGSNRLVLLAPYETSGLIIGEIGWHKPYIIARAPDADEWNMIDTEHARHAWIKDTERKATPEFQSIPVQPVEKAWEQLSSNNPLW